MAPKQEDIEQQRAMESSPLMGTSTSTNSFSSDDSSHFQKLRRHVFMSFLDTSQRPGVPVYDSPLWRAFHAFSFCLGGITFLIGTGLYYPAIYFAGLGTTEADATVAALYVTTAWLYTIGSMGFLSVDVQEFYTFTEDPWLRFNIFCSAFGSTLYVIGSAGFLPQLWALSPMIGIGGFIGGSAAIGGSQTWKLYRILSTHEAPYKASTINAACVEGGMLYYYAYRFEKWFECIHFMTNRMTHMAALFFLFLQQQAPWWVRIAF